MTEQPRPARARRPSLALALGLAAAFTLGGCGSDEEPTTIEVTPAADLPAATDLATQDQVVPVGQWAVVQVNDGSSKLIPVAVKITNITQGEPGQLSEVSSFTGDSEQIQTGTPWFITFHWSALSGTGWDSPVQSLWGWNTATDTSAMRLSLPPSQLGCDDALTPNSGEVGMDQIDCATAMFEDVSLELDQVRFVNKDAYPDGDNAIKFAAPAP